MNTCQCFRCKYGGIIKIFAIATLLIIGAFFFETTLKILALALVAFCVIGPIM